MTCCPIVELRQYTLRPGARDTLIDLFEREFIESQETLGMRLIGQFRDLDKPNRFVWLRGYDSMAARAPALDAFYGGPVWKAHREAANATMIDSDDVLLLRPAWQGSGFSLNGLGRAAVGAAATPVTEIVARICHLAEPRDDLAGREAHAGRFERQMKPALERAGIKVLAAFLTETSRNNFPALPVREGDNVLVWFERVSGSAEVNAPKTMIDSTRIETIRLEPTPRSLLR